MARCSGCSGRHASGKEALRELSIVHLGKLFVVQDLSTYCDACIKNKFLADFDKYCGGVMYQDVDGRFNVDWSKYSGLCEEAKRWIKKWLLEFKALTESHQNSFEVVVISVGEQPRILNPVGQKGEPLYFCNPSEALAYGTAICGRDDEWYVQKVYRILK